VPQSLTVCGLVDSARISVAYFKKYFNIIEPRFVLCALNPHASDHGIIGNEEQKILLPAVRAINKKMNSCCVGPMGADVALLRTMEGTYDAAIALYHDQALIALKLTGPHTGVNVTLGLPFVRTSPLHGTAFDIANTPRKINVSSFVAAIKTAYQCAINQRKASGRIS
jgi:4-hydroxythreonine-4-phosphate dehydrogenase